jgi:hypothetical protein
MIQNEKDGNLADFFLSAFPPSDEPPLPMPRFSKLPDQPARTLPEFGKADDVLHPWFDDEDLGIRVFIIEQQGANGIEICANVEGIRPDLLGKVVSVELMTEKRDRFRGLTIFLDKPNEDNSGCSGKESFGPAADLRKLLGDKVRIDVFLME